RAYFINTLGCIAGSICSGFILVPWIGIFATFLVMVVLNFFIGIIILFVSQKRFSLLQTMIAAIAIIAAGIFFFQAHPWSESLLTTNIAISPRTYLGYSKFELLSGIQQTESLYYKEGLSGVVSVKRHNDSVSLSINANVDASTGTDMHTQLMLGHLPSLLAENPKRALVIGMGSGVTLGALATYDYRELHCVELEGAVVEAAKYFSKENRNVLLDPRLKNFVNDGRNHLLVEHFVYDVIVSEPSSPWMAGVASLFTVEQFELMKKRLSPKGVACQWLNVYSMSPRNVQMIVKTFRKVFPHTSLWITNGPDLLLIGSKQPIIYDASAIDQMIKKNIFLAKDLKDFKIYDALGLLSCFLLSDQELNMITEDAPINSDNFPFLEYSAPLNLYGAEKVVLQNKAMIISRRTQRYPAMTSFPQSRSEKIDFHNKLARAFLQKNNFYEASVEIGLSNKEEALNKGVVLNYGILQVIGGNADEAITNLGNYLKDDPLSADACFYMAKAYDLKQLFDKALTYYQMAADREPDNPEYLFAYGESLVKNGNVAEGINLLQKVIDIKGLDFKNGLFLSQALIANQQFESAIKVLELLLKEYPHFYTLYETMAGCYQALGQDAEAISVYRKASKKLPFNARVYYVLSLLYQKTGEIKESRKMARKYLYYQNAPKIGTLQQSL
ncbi:MAG: tetratricopeptide repeat protein, partial [Candidatus Omnitrophota bacterium]